MLYSKIMRLNVWRSENDSGMEKHFAICQTPGPHFIIPFKYIVIELTTTINSILLKDINDITILNRSLTR